LSGLLHTALSCRVSFGTIELIIDTNPEDVFKKNSFGYFPLHTACVWVMSIQTYELLLSLHPDAAGVSIRAWSGAFPLHHCLSTLMPEITYSFVLRLIEACPSASSRIFVERYSSSYSLREESFVGDCAAAL
jgi:hypothetical protein